LVVSPGALFPSFFKDRTQYTLSLTNQTSVNLTPVRSDSRASIAVQIDDAAASPLADAGVSVPLKDGNTRVTIKTTAKNGAQKDYVIDIANSATATSVSQGVTDSAVYYCKANLPEKKWTAEDADFKSNPNRFSRDKHGDIYDNALKVTWVIPQAANLFHCRWKDAEKAAKNDGYELPTTEQLASLLTYQAAYRDGHELYVNTNYFLAPYIRSMGSGFCVWTARRRVASLLPDALGEFVSLTERTKGDYGGHDDEVANALFIRPSK